MRCAAALATSVALLAASGAYAGPRGWHGGGWHHGARHRTRVFIGGTFSVPPFYRGYPYWAPYYYPYSVYPYSVPYPVYPPPPPPEEPDWGSPPPDDGERNDETREAPPAEDVERASYGLVQLRGVPDGAAVDLDGRFWLEARDLDRRWLALPSGRHDVTVRVTGADPVERTIEVAPGKSTTVRVGPFPRARS